MLGARLALLCDSDVTSWPRTAPRLACIAASPATPHTETGTPDAATPAARLLLCRVPGEGRAGVCTRVHVCEHVYWGRGRYNADLGTHSRRGHPLKPG